MSILTKIFYSLLLCIAFQFGVVAQSLTKTLQLTIPGNKGANGGAVVWHPVYKKYFAYFFGNANFPITDFDEKGKPFITDPEKLLISGVDLRGVWYNTAKRRLEFNGYDVYGWGHYHTNNYGIIDSIYRDFAGMNQPYSNSIGVYNTDLNTVVFPSEDFIIYKYIVTNDGIVPEKLLALQLGCAKQSDADALSDSEWQERVNSRNKSVQYTGIPTREYAILNTEAYKIELYNAKTGLLTNSITVPEIVPLESFFNFSYSNKIWWFFNKEARTLLGYK